MNKFLAVLALTTALTGAANATQFDTSKVSIEEKSFLVVMISEHTANCPGEPWSLVKDLRLQLMSEIDTTTTIMDEPRQKVARAMDWKGKTSWCATTTDYFLKLNDKLAASPALLPSNAPSRPERVDYSSAPAKADALDSLIKFRTTEWQEDCTRHQGYAICTVGKSIGKVLGLPDSLPRDQVTAVYIAVPGLDKAPAANEAKGFCSEIKRPDLGTLLVSTFIKRQDGVILSCSFRK